MELPCCVLAPSALLRRCFDLQPPPPVVQFALQYQHTIVDTSHKFHAAKLSYETTKVAAEKCKTMGNERAR